ncbi:MAG: GTPase HflX [Desulfobaccales bacterium]
MERLYRRKVPVASLLTPELARQLAEISRSLHRQVGVLLDRQGVVSHVLVGDAKGLIIPPLPRERGVKGRLKGLRLIHTHLDASPLTRDDLMDLALLRLDAVAAVSAGADGQAGAIQVAHLLPRPLDGHNWAIIEASHPGALNLDFAALVASLEEELAQVETAGEEGRGRERAILIGVSGKNRAAAEDSMEELSELARSAGLEVAATLIQRRPRFDPRFLMGKGRLSELVVQGLQQGADLLVFDSELSPSQVRSITDFTELKVLDRTQLILDLFAQRARSREGKLQVEMAQVNYLLPRLVGKGDALSRLMGGIGGRGPGESKLEMDRRRLRDRLHRLRSELARVGAERRERRQPRRRQGLPVLSIIGYTNAGKSTLFNSLTKAGVLSEDRFFATLDPTSRRLRFPREREVIITDTVGFIKNLPKNLLEAFKATLEELAEADLLIHVVDLSSPRFVEQMAVVADILASLNLQEKPLLTVFNKADLADRNLAALQCRIHGGVAISAIAPGSLPPLIARLERQVDELAARTDWGRLQREL